MTELENKIGVVILAAGKGTRLGCIDRPKVMMEVGGRPILDYIIETLSSVGFRKDQISIVVGFQKEKVIGYFGSGFIYAHQEQQLGTAHAVWVGMQFLPKDLEQILVLNGDDSAFYTADTIQNFIDGHLVNMADLSVLTAEVEDNIQLGRVIRDSYGKFMKILEKEELSEAQKQIKEINTGTYLVDRKWFEEIFPRLEKIDGLGEYGMPTVVKMAVQEKKQVTIARIEDDNQWFGINNKEELEVANKRKYANR